MCLKLTEFIEKQIASNDIICYKRVRIDFSKYKFPLIHFVTPYQFAKVKLGETYTSKLICEINEYDESNLIVNIGLHSYTNYEDARRDGFGAVVECIIPKGAEYYEGYFRGRKSYASNELKYVTLY